MYECRYVYTNRKTVAIRVISADTVEVRAPRALPRGEVRDFVARSQAWIDRQVAMRGRYESRARSFRYGRVLWNGVETPVLPLPRRGSALTARGLEIPADRNARAQIAAYLRGSAASVLPKTAHELAIRFGYPDADIRLTSAATQWGNCNGARIRLHYTLVCLPARLREYVILHELTHLEHLDHSPAFWAALTARLPEAKALRAELKDYGWLLRLYRGGEAAGRG